LMGVTGPQWSFPWYRTGLQKTLGTYKEAPARSQQGQGGQDRGGQNREDGEDKKDSKPIELLSIESYMASADKVLPYQGNYRITLPQSGSDPVEITKNRTGFFA